MNEWRYYEPRGEPPFWGRKAGPNELDGFDPITGLIIAHTIAERDRLGPGR